jgi:hypothetical protein
MDSLDSMRSSSSDEDLKAIGHSRVVRPEMHHGQNTSLSHSVGRLVSWLQQRSSSDFCQRRLHDRHRSSHEAGGRTHGSAISLIRLAHLPAIAPISIAAVLLAGNAQWRYHVGARNGDGWMLGFLPWEKWLPAYVFGPFMCVGSICVLALARDLSWWKLLSAGFGIIFGALGTWIWFSTGRNIFWHSDLKTRPK